ncbi:MAG: HYR domain-containing protein, partial [Gaiellaceae bacterium]
DTTPPALSLPSAITAEATGPSGAVVSYSASASDLVDGPVTPVCSPASGSTFPLGTTTVTCTATDAAGNHSSGTFSVTVQDTTPPALSLPSAITAEATGPSGAVVSYSASASDLVDGPVTPVCSPASGSTFPLGTTTVTCTATDAAGNHSSGTFSVLVQDTTPPAVTASLVPLKRGGDDESTQRFQIVFSASDLVGVASLTATLNGVTVTNGQIVVLRVSKKPQKVTTEDGIVRISAGSFTLTVTAADAAGNSATATATPVFNKHGEDDESKGNGDQKGGDGHHQGG